MKFCPKCGGMLIKKGKFFVCAKCKYKTKEKINLKSEEKIENEKKLGVLREKDSSVWPTVNETCPKCGSTEVEFWTTQMRAGDEAETRFFRCRKCRYTWRDYT